MFVRATRIATTSERVPQVSRAADENDCRYSGQVYYFRSGKLILLFT